MNKSLKFLITARRFGAMVLLVGVTATQIYPAQQPPQTARPPIRAPQGSPAPVILEKITREQFRSMPPGALVTYKGQIISKSDYVSLKLKEWNADKASPKTVTMAASEANPAQSESIQAQRAELTARNAQLQAEFEKMRVTPGHLTEIPQYAALSKEAFDLRSRYANASVDEKAKIKQRAMEVYSQLVQLENTSAPAQR